MTTVPRRVLMILSSVLVACDRRPTAPPPTVESVVVSPASATLLALDQPLVLHATALTSRGDSIPGKIFTWASSNSGIVPVTADGVATSNVEGIVTITATTDGISGSATITVTQVPVALAFAQAPAGTFVGMPVGNIQVWVLDANHRAVNTAAPAVTLSLGGSTGGATLSGASAPSLHGMANFPSLTIDREGNG